MDVHSEAKILSLAIESIKCLSKNSVKSIDDLKVN